MAKKILLIENDQAFADRLSASLEESGFEARATGDGKEGLELARDWAPQAIVLCVELPGMSGYLVCQKLKKDDALKPIPLVLTSAEATEETFEKHRTLKARADDYLLKPYEPAALAGKLGALIGLPEPAAAEPPTEEAEEELVSLEEEIGLAPTGEPDGEIPALDLEALADEPSPGEPSTVLDEDLRLLDDAFDGIAAPPAGGAREAAAALDELAGEKPVAVDEVDAAAASLPEEDEAAGRAALGALDLDPDAGLGALADVDETLSPGFSLRGDPPLRGPDAAQERGSTAALAAAAAAAGAVIGAAAASRPTVRGASTDLLRAAGIRMLDEDAAPGRGPVLVPPPPEPSAHAALGADAAELARLRGELDEARAALERVRADLGARDGEVRDLRRKAEALGRRADDSESEVAQARARAEAAQEKARKAEGDAKRAAEEARDAEAELSELRERSGELERRASEAERRTAAAEEEARRKVQDAAAATEALSRAETLEREADELRTELLVARGEAEGARGEVEKRTADLRKRAADLEAASAKNEERVVKAYQKIKADEKVRDKVRKALAIATQLLEEGLPEAPTGRAVEAPTGRAVGRDPERETSASAATSDRR